MMIRAPLD